MSIPAEAPAATPTANHSSHGTDEPAAAMTVTTTSRRNSRITATEEDR